MRVFITGVSSGIGFELAKLYLEKGDEVVGVSRREVELPIKHFKLDISNFREVAKLENLGNFDLAILNAGILNRIDSLSKTTFEEIEEVMKVNVWANKEIIDRIDAKQIVAISSGASVNGNKGWGSYSLSKATLNMLIKLYATEKVDTHFTSLAPGVIETPMLNSVLDSDEVEFPSIRYLKDVQKFSPKESAQILSKTFPKLLKYSSGSFLDIREMN
jgi:NAD(P)-dependent dehydrogenase (short-subunit alcohol dehydrogenase family)